MRRSDPLQAVGLLILIGMLNGCGPTPQRDCLRCKSTIAPPPGDKAASTSFHPTEEALRP
ncbi:hypothetical protein [Nitratifractor sp.]